MNADNKRLSVPKSDPCLSASIRGSSFFLYRARILDPACGSGGMFIQSARFVEAHQNPTPEISVHGQDQWAWGTHLRRAQRARRVRQRRKLPNNRVTDTVRIAYC